MHSVSTETRGVKIVNTDTRYFGIFVLARESSRTRMIYISLQGGPALQSSTCDITRALEFI